MNHSLSSIRWLRVLSAALAVMALSFLILTVIITVYAFILAFQARGAPDQNAINHFAARVSPKLMPWLYDNHVDLVDPVKRFLFHD